jgi:valyl-tRNA synthetase
MIMLSLKLTGKVPFTEVYCHSLIRDSEGRKMSKSLGNVVDPIDIMDGITLKDLNDKLLIGNLDPKELKTATKYQQTSFPQGIPECGADALRFALISYTTGGGDIAFDVRVIHGYRRFANKIYQATKYVLGKVPADFVPNATAAPSGKESLAESWILHRFNEAAKKVNQQLEDREFSRSTQTIYEYIYDYLCDVYIENSKAILQDGSDAEKASAMQTLYTTIEGALLLIHPYMPFLSEELWQRLPRRQGDKTPSITIARFPKFDSKFENQKSADAYELVLSCSKAIRSLIAEYRIDKAKVYVLATGSTSHSTISAQVQAIRSLSGKGLNDVTILAESDAPPTGCAVYVADTEVAVFLEVKGKIDVQDEIDKAKTKLKKASEGAAKLTKLLGDASFKEKVSSAVFEAEEQKLDGFKAQKENYERSLEQFETLKLE